MKKLVLMFFLAAHTAVSCSSQSTDEKAIREVITAFAKAADKNDVASLDKYLDANFRVVMNRLFGSTEVGILPRDVYMEKIRTKEFGGDDRKITIENICLNGSSASAKVTFAGSKMTFVSIVVLIKDDKGIWKLVSDVPSVK
jgi:ketosteroid isomerase-like protein